MSCDDLMFADDFPLNSLNSIRLARRSKTVAGGAALQGAFMTTREIRLVPAQLESFRQRRSLTQEELADAAALSSRMIHNAFAGNPVSVKAAQALMRALNIDDRTSLIHPNDLPVDQMGSTKSSSIVARERELHVAVLVDVSSNYGRGVVEGVSRYLEDHEKWSIYLNSRATGRVDPEWIENWAGDGIVAYIDDLPTERLLHRIGIPVVEVYGHGMNSTLPTVCGDDIAIGRVAAEHLMTLGVKHFAFCGYENVPWSKLRGDGFLHGIESAGYECSVFNYPRSLDTLREWEVWQQRLSTWLLEQPRGVGILACTDRHAQRVLDSCRRAGLEVPHDVAVIGVDDDATLCQLANPPLSSVADNPQKIGYEAAALLSRLMRGEPTSITNDRKLIAPRGVVARRSTQVTRSQDLLITEILRYMRDANCAETSVKELLQKFEISRSALFRRFRQATGRSPHEELMRIRLERACYLLVHSQRTIAEISRLCGFEHPEYLGVVFKKILGRTPGEYRQEQA